MKMTIKPCAVCRDQRRKCIRSDPTQPCARCVRLHQPCVQSFSNQEEQTRLKLYNTQIEELKLAMQCIEKEINQHKLSALVSAMSRHFHGWQFQIRNGMISIDTSIKSISDLLPIQYLSPLSADCGTPDICSINRSEPLLLFTQQHHGNWVNFFLSVLERPNQPICSLMPSKKPISRALVDQMVAIFFQCHSMFNLCLHKPSFYARYSTLDDPLLDLITLSICCLVCATPCDHMNMISPQEQRALADYFFERCKSIILDQFDDYSKRLENVNAVVLLAQYMHVTFRFSDCRHLLDLAYSLCLDLERDFKKKEVTESIGRALFKRHFYFIIFLRRIINCVANENFYAQSCLIPQLEAIADEDEETRQLIRACNWNIWALNNPFLTQILKQVNLAYVGKIGVFSFESLVRLETFIDEWVSMVPDDIRLCDDYHNQEACEAAIRQTTDGIKLLAFSDFCLLQLWIHCFVLQPLPSQTMNEQLSSYVLQKSIEKLSKLLHLIVRLVHRSFEVALNKKQCKLAVIGYESLIVVVDLLLTLNFPDNKYLPKDIRAQIQSICQMLNKLHYMYNICANYGVSPIKSLLSGDNRSMQHHIEYYDQSSHPWISVIYDATCYISFCERPSDCLSIKPST